MNCPYSSCPFNIRETCTPHDNKGYISYSEAVYILDQCENPELHIRALSMLNFIAISHYRTLSDLNGQIPFLYLEKDICDYMLDEREDYLLPDSPIWLSLFKGEEYLLDFISDDVS